MDFEKCRGAELPTALQEDDSMEQQLLMDAALDGLLHFLVVMLFAFPCVLSSSS